jgi:hypothetical protein
MVNIYVGNLPFSMSEAELEGLFAPHGQVQRVNLVMDRETGRPRGFGFVEMASEEHANAAIQALDGTQVGSRKIVVNIAKPREERGPRTGGGGGRGGYGGGGGGYGGGGGGYGGGGGGGYGGGGGGGYGGGGGGYGGGGGGYGGGGGDRGGGGRDRGGRGERRGGGGGGDDRGGGRDW